jgi:hypothetical protein
LATFVIVSKSLAVEAGGSSTTPSARGSGTSSGPNVMTGSAGQSWTVLVMTFGGGGGWHVGHFVSRKSLQPLELIAKVSHKHHRMLGSQLARQVHGRVPVGLGLLELGAGVVAFV